MNFVESLRQRKIEDPNAEPLEGSGNNEPPEDGVPTEAEMRAASQDRFTPDHNVRGED